jgi:hypothetical protein
VVLSGVGVHDKPAQCNLPKLGVIRVCVKVRSVPCSIEIEFVYSTDMQ